MALHRESSMLSDDLKPRRTPVPSSLEHIVPRPSVPDLSIIEVPQANSLTQPTTAEAGPQPSLNQLSYNDWRQKVSGSAPNGSMSNGHRYSNVAIPENMKQPASHSPINSISSASFKEISSCPKVRVNMQSPSTYMQPAGKVVSYSELQKRPVTAPVARPSQSTGVGGISNEHPLSKSAPARRVSPNGHETHARGPIHHIQPNFGHTMPSSVSQHYFPASQGLSTASLGPRPDLNSYHMELKGHQNHVNQCNDLAQNETHLSIVPRDYAKRFPYNEILSPSQHVLSTSGGGMNHICQLGCCQGHLHHNNNNPCPCEKQACLSSVMNVAPHVSANCMHPLPSCAIQQKSSSSQVSYEDLYKIVLAQNDQLKALQSQVDRLLVTQEEHKAIIKSSIKEKERDRLPLAISNPTHNMVSEEGTQTSDCEAIEDGCQKMSIGVMTSFIHAVTYRSRVERLDAVHNVSEHENILSNGNHAKQSKSLSSDDGSSSSLSPKPKSKASNEKPHKNCKTCCQDCMVNESHKESSRKHVRNDKLRQNTNNEAVAQYRKQPENTDKCPENCNCNNPGVSAAITAVRGCQAVLASRTGMGTQEFSTFNGADLPTVTEQPLSPMSSIHVDLHDYRSSSSDESNSSQSSEEASSEEDQKDSEHPPKHNGWTFYNNVLGQVNKILEERDVGSTATQSELTTQQVMAVQAHKQTDTSISKRVAFEAQDGKEVPQNLKELALRYLRENHPEELTSSSESARTKKSCAEKVQEMAVYNMPASNMSFATFRYLERYNLLPDNFNPQQYLEATANMHGFHGKQGNSHELNHGHTDRGLHGTSRKHSRIPSGKLKSRHTHAPSKPPNEGRHQVQSINNGLAKHYGTPTPVHHPSPRKQHKSNTPTSKILDITTLRQQPKLL